MYYFRDNTDLDSAAVKPVKHVTIETADTIETELGSTSVTIYLFTVSLLSVMFL